MKKRFFTLNRAVAVLNLLLIGLGCLQIVDLKKTSMSRFPLLVNLFILALLGFFVFCMYYAPYLRDKALNI